MTVTDSLPAPVVRRLPRYLVYVRELKELGIAWVSSVDLAHALNLTSSTVRQDLSHLLDLVGVSKRGYELTKLEAALVKELGADRSYRVVIVGAGFLGSALALHGSLQKQGFEVCAILDNNPELIGTAVGKLSIRSMDALPHIIENEGVSIGIIAVPRYAAQAVADELIAHGVRALLNLAYVQLNVPPHVEVMDARIISSLQELTYVMQQNKEEPSGNRLLANPVRVER